MVFLPNATPRPSQTTPSQASKYDLDLPRRALLLGARATAAALCADATPALAAGELSSGRPGIDRSCRVSAARLDTQVANAFALFNKPAVLPPFDAQKNEARSDVDLHRIATHGGP
jgi:hypothetical protein